MISVTLWKREWKANYKLIVLFLLALTLYGGVVVAMYDPKLGESLMMMAEQMPQLFAAFGMSNPGSTLLEFCGNYLYGFILIVIPFLCIVLMNHRLIVRYVDRGSMCYLLATPNSRGKIIRTQMVFLLTVILLMCAFVTILVPVAGQLMFHEGIAMDRFLLLNVGLLGLLLALAGVSFLTATSFNEAKRAIGLGAGIGIFFILVQMLAKISDKMEFLKYVTITSLFQSDRIIYGDGNVWLPLCGLYLIAIVCFGLGCIIFQKRDLPL